MHFLRPSAAAATSAVVQRRRTASPAGGWTCTTPMLPRPRTEQPKGSQACADASRASALHKSAETAPARSRVEEEPAMLGVPMKWLSLVALTLQTSAQACLIKWARTSAGEARYVSSTVVLFTELLKAAVSFLLVASASGGLRRASAVVVQQLGSSPVETLKVCVPSLLYTVQNNLMFVSLSKLSVAVQQVTYQLKIFTTALLSVLLLGRVLGPTRWLSLVGLVIGVSLVQWPSDGKVSSGAAGGFGLREDALLGFCAVLAACFTSGFASVYLEKLLKNTSASIWERNVQLGLFGSIMGLVGALWVDGAAILESGFTQGYDWRVVLVVLNNALGGLLCAAVLKYADNILRCFSTALSIILTCLLSAYALREYEPDSTFISGTTLAILSTALYNLGPTFLARLAQEQSAQGVAKAD